MHRDSTLNITKPIVQLSHFLQDSDQPVRFQLKAQGSMAPPDVEAAGSETDVSEEEEEAKQTNGPKQELWVIFGISD